MFIPPLRERKEDIVPLALDVMAHFNTELKKNFVGFTPGAAEPMKDYPWPSNIRELRNVPHAFLGIHPTSLMRCLKKLQEVG